MALVPNILEEALKQAFIAGETAMEEKAKSNSIPCGWYWYRRTGCRAFIMKQNHS